MKKTLIVVGIFILAMTATAGIFWGCNSKSGVDQPVTLTDNPSLNRHVSMAAALFAIQDKEGKAAALRSALGKPHVATARQWLQSQGYTPVDTCVAVFVQLKYDTIPVTAQVGGPSALRPNPDLAPRTLLRSADTIVWQAFENPAHDMGNYTGIATAWRNAGAGETILAEMDISTSKPRVLRQGWFHEGVFEPGDAGVETFNECLGDCVLPGVFACALTGPAYLECVGAVAVTCTIYCAGKSLFAWLKS